VILHGDSAAVGKAVKDCSVNLPCRYYRFLTNLKYPPPTNSIDIDAIPIVAVFNSLPFFDSISSCAHRNDERWIYGVVSDEDLWLRFIAAVEASYPSDKNYHNYIWFKKCFQNWAGLRGENQRELKSPPLYSFWEIKFWGSVKKTIAFLAPTIKEFNYRPNPGRKGRGAAAV